MTALLVLAVLARSLFVAVERDASELLLAPAGGLVVACVAMERRRHWPVLTLGVVLVVAATLLAGRLAGLALGAQGVVGLVTAAVAAAVVAVVGARVLRLGRGGGGQVDGLRAFTAFAAALVCAGGAGAAVELLAHVAVAALGRGEQSGSDSAYAVFFGAWRARSLGVLVVTPAVLSFGGLWRPVVALPATARVRRLRRLEWWSWLVAMVLALALTMTPVGAELLPGGKEYLLLPPLFWAGLRFDLRTSGGAVLAVAAVLLALTAAGHGPFGGEGYELLDGCLAAQAFVGVAGITTLLAGAAVADRRRGEEERVQLAARLERARDLGAVGRLAQQVARELGVDLTMARAACEQLARRGRRGDDAVEALGGSLARAEAAAARLFTLGARERPARVELVPLVEGVVAELRRDLRTGLRLDLEVTPGLPRVRVEHVDVETLLGDLVANAERASHSGGRICVRVGESYVDRHLREHLPHLQEGPYVALEVEDEGVGMDESLLERAFEPGTTTHRAEGALGLGLAAVRATARALGGDVALRSELGRGTRAVVLLPPAGSSRVSTLEPPRRTRESGTILVVEDERLLRDFLMRALEGESYEVLVAPEGEAALELAYNRPGRIDLLLVDLELPGRDGLSIAREFVGVQPGARVLFMSGAVQAPPATTRLAGSSGFLAKPFTVGHLRRAVAHALRVRGPE